MKSPARCCGELLELLFRREWERYLGLICDCGGIYLLHRQSHCLQVGRLLVAHSSDLVTAAWFTRRAERTAQSRLRTDRIHTTLLTEVESGHRREVLHEGY